MGSNIAIDEGSVEVMDDRELARRANAMSKTLAEKAAELTRKVWPCPF